VAIQYLDNIKVAGIRASATDAKVLMNDRVYRIGSVVSGEMGLRLVGIAGRHQHPQTAQANGEQGLIF
jgi:hypothetical protein